VIDPLDGTSSYVRGFPTYTVSIGVEVDGVPTIGAVIDAIGRRTSGILGGGAERDGRPVAMSERTSLEGAILATGFAYRPEQRRGEAEVVLHLIAEIADLRRSGSAAFDLCAVATGEVDAYYEMYLAPWDIAGGAAIVRAAGGIVESFEQPDGEVLWVACPPQLFEPMVRLLGGVGLSVA
jgi:myo-inositol-1(or 4)-monophosphatase